MITNRKDNPSVSVIIPTYNRASTLERSIRSVLNQSYKDFELIIVDDGSTDNTKEIVKSITDKRIIYVRQDNKGACSARNKGIKISKGKFIAFQDSDDEWLPDKLEEQMKVIEKSDSSVGAVYGGYFINGKKYFPEKFNSYNGKIYFPFLENKGKILLVSLIVKKSVLNKVGYFDEKIKVLEDKDLVLRILKEYLVVGVNKPLIKYNISPDSISRNRNYFIKGIVALLDKNRDYIKNNKKILGINYSRLAYEYYLVGDEKEAKKYFLRGFKNSMFDFYLVAYLVARILGRNNFFRVINIVKRG